MSSTPSNLDTLLVKFKELAKSETVFGDPIQAGETTLIPVSKVSLGFASTGSGKKEGLSGQGGGAKITPIAFISIQGDNIKVHHLENGGSDYARLLSLAPEVLEKVIQFIDKKGEK